MLYVIETTFCLETSTPFPVSFQPMKLSSSLIVPFLCLFVGASLHFLLFFLSLFFSFVFFLLYAFGKSYYHQFLILQRRINYLNVIVDF